MPETNETKIALLEQRIAFLEADEQRQRNWKMRIYGWIIGPAIALLLGGLTIYAQVNYNIIPQLKEITVKVEKAIDVYNAATDLYNNHVDEHH